MEKKKKKKKKFCIFRSFFEIYFWEETRIDTKYTKNIPQNDRYIFFLFRFFLFFYEKSKVGRFSKTSIFAERRLRRTNGPNSHEFSPFTDWK